MNVCEYSAGRRWQPAGGATEQELGAAHILRQEDNRLLPDILERRTAASLRARLSRSKSQVFRHFIYCSFLL